MDNKRAAATVLRDLAVSSLCPWPGLNPRTHFAVELGYFGEEEEPEEEFRGEAGGWSTHLSEDQRRNVFRVGFLRAREGRLVHRSQSAEYGRAADELREAWADSLSALSLPFAIPAPITEED